MILYLFLFKMKNIKEERSVDRSTDITGCLSKKNFDNFERPQVKSNYLNTTFQKVQLRNGLVRKNSFHKKSKRTASYTQGTETKVKQILYSVPVLSNQDLRSKNFRSKTTDLSLKERDTPSLDEDGESLNFYTEAKRIETLSNHHIQLTHYNNTYGGLTFSCSEVISGPKPVRSLKKEVETVNKAVRRQFQPILNYQFSKLYKKDILPSLSQILKQSLSSKLRQRMEFSLNESRISNSFLKASAKPRQ